jgi:hypothetical protein
MCVYAYVRGAAVINALANLHIRCVCLCDLVMEGEGARGKGKEGWRCLHVFISLHVYVYV